MYATLSVGYVHYPSNQLCKYTIKQIIMKHFVLFFCYKVIMHVRQHSLTSNHVVYSFYCDMLQEFIPQGVHGYVPAEFITDEGFYSSSPTKHSLDGAFAARLIRSMN